MRFWLYLLASITPWVLGMGVAIIFAIGIWNTVTG